MKRERNCGLAPDSILSGVKVKLLITLVAALFLLESTEASYQLKDINKCFECIQQGNFSCRPNYYDVYSFCCEEGDAGSRNCGGDSYCSTGALNPGMYGFTCPYERHYCGADESEIKLHPTDRNNILIDIKNAKFQSQSVCYYQLFVGQNDMDTDNFNYYIDLEFTRTKNVIVVMNNGTSYATADDPITVSFASGFDFTYDVSNGQSIFLVFIGTEVSKLYEPHFTVSVKVSTTKKRGSTIIDPNSGNSTTKGPPTIITEIIYVDGNSTASGPNPWGDRPRKAQWGLTVLSGASVFGIILFAIVDAICDCCATTSKKKVKSFQSFNEIEVKPSDGNDFGETKRGAKQLGILDSARGSARSQEQGNDEAAVYEQLARDGDMKHLESAPDVPGALKLTDRDRLQHQDSWTSANKGHAMEVDLSKNAPQLSQKGSARHRKSIFVPIQERTRQQLDGLQEIGVSSQGSRSKDPMSARSPNGAMAPMPHVVIENSDSDLAEANDNVPDAARMQEIHDVYGVGGKSNRMHATAGMHGAKNSQMNQLRAVGGTQQLLIRQTSDIQGGRNNMRGMHGTDEGESDTFDVMQRANSNQIDTQLLGFKVNQDRSDTVSNSNRSTYGLGALKKLNMQGSSAQLGNVATSQNMASKKKLASSASKNLASDGNVDFTPKELPKKPKFFGKGPTSSGSNL